MASTTQRYALIDGSNRVINVCLWDGNPRTWSPPEGIRAELADDDTEIGDTHDDAEGFAKPRREEPPPLAAPKSELAGLLDLLVAEGVVSAAKAAAFRAGPVAKPAK